MEWEGYVVLKELNFLVEERLVVQWARRRGGPEHVRGWVVRFVESTSWMAYVGLIDRVIGQ